MASAVRPAVRQVRPILSINESEARKRVFQLYKSWYRQVPYIRKLLIFSLSAFLLTFIRDLTIPNLKIVCTFCNVIDVQKIKL